MKIESWQETDPDLIEKSRARFGDEINNLRSLGFLELCHYTEMLPPFSLATFFFGFLLMIAKREIVRVESPLRIAMTQPLMAQSESGTYALVFGLGVKFYTLFTDGTGLISASFDSQPTQDMQLMLYKYAGKRSIEDCWRAHRNEIESFTQAGKEVELQIRFDNYVSLSERENPQSS